MAASLCLLPIRRRVMINKSKLALIAAPRRQSRPAHVCGNCPMLLGSSARPCIWLFRDVDGLAAKLPFRLVPRRRRGDREGYGLHTALLTRMSRRPSEPTVWATAATSMSELSALTVRALPPLFSTSVTIACARSQEVTKVNATAYQSLASRRTISAPIPPRSPCNEGDLAL